MRSSRPDPEPLDHAPRRVRHERDGLIDATTSARPNQADAQQINHTQTKRPDQPVPTARQATAHESSGPLLRFAFYGRAHGDAAFVRACRVEQRATARNVIDVSGEIVAEYFDSGPTAWVNGVPPISKLPWGKGPRARALIEALRRREFDAVVVGDLDTDTFGTTPLWEVVAFLGHYGRQLWIPDVKGPLDPNDEVDVLLMRILVGIPIPDAARQMGSSESKRSSDPRRARPRDVDQ